MFVFRSTTASALSTTTATAAATTAPAAAASTATPTVTGGKQSTAETAASTPAGACYILVQLPYCCSVCISQFTTMYMLCTIEISLYERFVCFIIGSSARWWVSSSNSNSHSSVLALPPPRHNNNSKWWRNNNNNSSSTACLLWINSNRATLCETILTSMACSVSLVIITSWEPGLWSMCWCRNKH